MIKKSIVHYRSSREYLRTLVLMLWNRCPFSHQAEDMSEEVCVSWHPFAQTLVESIYCFLFIDRWFLARICSFICCFEVLDSIGDIVIFSACMSIIEISFRTFTYLCRIWNNYLITDRKFYNLFIFLCRDFLARLEALCIENGTISIWKDSVRWLKISSSEHEDQNVYRYKIIHYLI